MVKKPTRLFFSDYDGPAVKSRPESFSIMREALSLSLDTSKIVWDMSLFDVVAQATRGSTELNFFSVLAERLKIPQWNWKRLFKKFMKTRAQLIGMDNDRRGVLHFDQNDYYTDFLELLLKIEKQDQELGIRTLKAIITGNPLQTMQRRIIKEMSGHLDFIVGGEEGRTRADLLKQGLIRANNLGYEYRIGSAFYCDDVAKGLVEGMGLGFAPIYIAREQGGEAEILTDEKDDENALLEKGINRAVELYEKNPSNQIQAFLVDQYDPVLIIAGGFLNPEFAFQFLEDTTDEDRRNTMMVVYGLDDSRIMPFINPRRFRNKEGGTPRGDQGYLSNPKYRM